MSDQCEDRVHAVIGACYAVYNTLGFGFLEAVYTGATARELELRGWLVRREVLVAVEYKDRQVAQYRLDMVVDNNVILEIKAGFQLHKAASHQLVNYVRATGYESGVLFHFGPEPWFYRVDGRRWAQ